MNIQQILRTQTELLIEQQISTARLDVLVLLSDELDKDKSWILAHPEYELAATQLSSLRSKVKQRVKHEPLAYIRGRTDFYGRTYVVNGHTLEPRPESETMIDLLKNILRSDKWQMISGKHIIDVGTGSGAIGITAKLEIPELTVMGTDISKECIGIAKQNAKNLDAGVDFYTGNLLEPALNDIRKMKNEKYMVLTNLPYVPEHYELNKAAEFEPRLAIFGGTDGLDIYRQMFAQIKQLKYKPSYIFTESLPFQHEQLAKIAAGADYHLQQSEDFIQIFNI